MEKAVILGWSMAAILGVCGMTVGLRQAPWPPVHFAGTELRAGDFAAPSPAYTETNCSCSQFTCGSVDYPACNAVCSAPKHAVCSQGTCSGPAGFESASPNACRCE
jgi:hypothetical protein